jgi:hypothetical protein
MSPDARYARALQSLQATCAALGELIARADRSRRAGLAAELALCDSLATALDRVGLDVCTGALALGQACDAEADRLAALVTRRTEAP